MTHNMTKASSGTLRLVMGEENQSMEMNIDQGVNIVDDIIDPDLFLRSFGISDDYVNCDHLKDTNVFDTMGQISAEPVAPLVSANAHKPGVIMKNSNSNSGSLAMMNTPVMPPDVSTMAETNSFARQRNASSVTLEQRTQENINTGEQLVSIPMSTLHNILYQQQQQQQQSIAMLGQLEPDPLDQIAVGVKSQRKRTQDQMKCPDTPPLFQPVFTVPSPVNISPVYVDQKLVSMDSCDDQIMTMMSAPVCRPSPQSTPPPASSDLGDPRKYKSRSGRITPTGKRSRPQTPTSDSESDGGWRDREPLSWASGRTTPVEVKPSVRLEDLVDEDKYNKRKRSTSGGEAARGKAKDPMKAMLEQLQQVIPHIGNPDEEKVSHAGLLVEGSDYIRSLKRENNTTSGNVEHLKLKIDQLHAEIEAFQEKLPEHGSSSIHRIVSKRGKSIPDMFADHVRQKTQSDWKYWVYTSIMGHFVHSFAQEVSNISPQEMERTSTEWVQEKMSMTQLRKDAFRKLAKLCSKTSIMEDPSKLPEEARGFVALSDSDQPPAENVKQQEFE